MKSYRLSKENLGYWIKNLVDSENRIIGPVKAGEVTLFAKIENPEDLCLGEGLTVKSGKGVFFPQSEVILRYEKKDGKTVVEDVDNFAPPTVLLGIRPCDAAGVEILDSVFGWDYKDQFYLKRRENTTIVTAGCLEPVDEDCFCTSVGLGPDSRVASDIFTAPHPEGGLYLEVLTEKGEKLLAPDLSLFEETGELDFSESAEKVPKKFNLEKIKPWLDEHFDDEMWKEMSLRCVGCGTCSFLCPTCHCFDIVDETRQSKGVRLKNWDSCQFGLFTKHASGHNPREVQSERYRQRMMHKFKYYPEKFEKTLCVGCGRCVRACPVGHSILDYLKEIEKRAESEPAKV